MSFDNIVSLILNAFVGFFLGLFVVPLIGYGMDGDWLFVVVALALFILIGLFFMITDKPLDWLTRKLAPEQLKEEPRESKRHIFIGGAIGFALSFVAIYFGVGDDIVDFFV
ncbi:MAG: hypothetical protein HKN27_10040 [Silicimonas sp.]|nr:hypothetical protein [Silicimonas sp.]